MQFKTLLVEFAAILLVVSVAAAATFPEYCAECEQEVWEEVPCSEVPSTTSRPPYVSSTTSPKPLPTMTTYKPTMPPTTSVATTPATTRIHTTTSSPPQQTTTSQYEDPTSSDPYRKCYCECKVGCKEFCRKVIVSGPKQQIVHVSSTSDADSGAQIEFKHVHQRKVYPNPNLPPPVNHNNYPLTYSGVEPNLGLQPYIDGLHLAGLSDINMPGYGVNELNSLLKSDYVNRQDYQNLPPTNYNNLDYNQRIGIHTAEPVSVAQTVRSNANAIKNADFIDTYAIPNVAPVYSNVDSNHRIGVNAQAGRTNGDAARSMHSTYSNVDPSQKVGINAGVSGAAEHAYRSNGWPHLAYDKYATSKLAPVYSNVGPNQRSSMDAAAASATAAQAGSSKSDVVSNINAIDKYTISNRAPVYSNQGLNQRVGYEASHEYAPYSAHAASASPSVSFDFAIDDYLKNYMHDGPDLFKPEFGTY